MCWHTPGTQGGWRIHLQWMKCHCPGLRVLSLAENTSCNNPTSCTAHLNAPLDALVHTNSRHLLKLLKQMQLILLEQSKECPPKSSCQQRQLLSAGQLITNTKGARDVLLWFSFSLGKHPSLTAYARKECIIPLFCLLFVEKSVSRKKRTN